MGVHRAFWGGEALCFFFLSVHVSVYFRAAGSELTG